MFVCRFEKTLGIDIFSNKYKKYIHFKIINFAFAYTKLSQFLMNFSVLNNMLYNLEI